jgi:transposase
LALSTALPLPILGGGDLIGGLVGTVSGLLNTVTKTVSDLLNSTLPSILNIPSGTDPLSFVQQLIGQLDGIISQLLNGLGIGSGLPLDEILKDVEGLASGVVGDVSQLVQQLSQILNLKDGNIVGALQQLIAALEKLLQQILQAVIKLLQELSGDLTNLDLSEVLANLQVFGLIQTLTQQLKTILALLQKANL